MHINVAWRIACHKVDQFFAGRNSSNGRTVVKGRPRVFTSSDQLTLFMKMCRTSQPWSAIHPQYKTLHRNFRQLVDGGVFESIQRQIVRMYTSRRSAKHHITDTSYIKNVLGRDVIGRNPTDRGRMATKLSTITDDSGVVLLFALFPGNTSDQRVLPPTLQEFRPPLGMGNEFGSNIRTHVSSNSDTYAIATIISLRRFRHFWSLQTYALLTKRCANVRNRDTRD